MLHRAENVTITHRIVGLTFSKGYEIVSIGNREYQSTTKSHKDDFARAMERQLQYPVLVLKIGERTYWMFQNKFYWDNEDLTAEQVYALLVAQQQRRRRQIETAQQIVAVGSEPRSSNQRTAIPDDIKHLVWIRDGGRCRKCGATSELQFDHIIPVALGGGNSAENVQILCGLCNRRKSAGLTM